MKERSWREMSYTIGKLWSRWAWIWHSICGESNISEDIHPFIPESVTLCHTCDNHPQVWHPKCLREKKKWAKTLSENFMSLSHIGWHEMWQKMWQLGGYKVIWGSGFSDDPLCSSHGSMPNFTLILNIFIAKLFYAGFSGIWSILSGQPGLGCSTYSTLRCIQNGKHHILRNQLGVRVYETDLSF